MFNFSLNLPLMHVALKPAAASQIYRILHKCMLDLGMPPHDVIDWAESSWL